MSKKIKDPARNLTVSTTPEMIEEIDNLVISSPVPTTRSGIALAAIRAGLPEISRQLRGGKR